MDNPEIFPEDAGDVIWRALVDWVDDSPLPEDIRKEFADRAKFLRLRMQALVLEIQKRAVLNVAVDMDAEADLRLQMRNSIPYMTPLERVQTLRSLADTRNKYIEEISLQVAGWDMFDAIEFSMETMSDIRASGVIVGKLKKMEPEKRQKILDTLMTLKRELEAKNVSQSTD